MIYCSYTIYNNPVQSGEAPTNNSIDVTISPDCYVLLTDADGDDMNATWHTNASGTWVQFGTNSSVSSGTNITQTYQNFKGYNTTYWWSVNVSDGEGGWTNETYSFITELLPSGGTTYSHSERGDRVQIGFLAGAMILGVFAVLISARGKKR